MLDITELQKSRGDKRVAVQGCKAALDNAYEGFPQLLQLVSFYQFLFKMLFHETRVYIPAERWRCVRHQRW